MVRHTSIRLLLSIVCHNDLELEQLDVKTAFLHGDLNEVIYLRVDSHLVMRWKGRKERYASYRNPCMALNGHQGSEI